MSSKKIIDKKKQEELKEIDKISKESRFGFFSIPYNQIIGDGYYSSIKYNNHKVDGRKVIIEKRGIYTTPGKSGKGHDAYFLSFDTTDKNVQERLKNGLIEDKMKILQKKEEMTKKHNLPIFKYPGIQERRDNYFYEPEGRKLPLYRDPPKNYIVINRKVYGERRGIYTQPMKKGLYNTPNICFSYIPFHQDYEYLKTFKKPRLNIKRKPKYYYIPPKKKKRNFSSNKKSVNSKIKIKDRINSAKNINISNNKIKK